MLSAKTFVLWALCLFASACADSITPQTGAPVANVVTSYKLGTGDQLRVIVYDEADLSGDFSIGADGTLSMPLIGAVHASDRTAPELASDIRAKLLQGYLRDPHVAVEILTYRPFYILGEVTRPGEYPYSVGLTVMSAVAKAEGFTYRANQRRIFIKAAGSNHEVEVPLTASTPVAPGDTIRIGERYF